MAVFNLNSSIAKVVLASLAMNVSAMVTGHPYNPNDQIRLGFADDYCLSPGLTDEQKQQQEEALQKLLLEHEEQKKKKKKGKNPDNKRKTEASGKKKKKKQKRVESADGDEWDLDQEIAALPAETPAVYPTEYLTTADAMLLAKTLQHRVARRSQGGPTNEHMSVVGTPVDTPQNPTGDSTTTPEHPLQQQQQQQQQQPTEFELISMDGVEEAGAQELYDACEKPRVDVQNVHANVRNERAKRADRRAGHFARDPNQGDGLAEVKVVSTPDAGTKATVKRGDTLYYTFNGSKRSYSTWYKFVKHILSQMRSFVEQDDQSFREELQREELQRIAAFQNFEKSCNALEAPSRLKKADPKTRAKNLESFFKAFRVFAERHEVMWRAFVNAYDNNAKFPTV